MYFEQPWNEKKGISITPNKKYRYICLVVMNFFFLKKKKKERKKEKNS